MTIEKDNLENRLTQLKPEVLTRGFDRYASELKNVSDLPTELQSPAFTTLATSEALQTIIVLPPQIHRVWNYVPMQAVLFSLTGAIHLQASIWADEEPPITYLNGFGLL